MPIMVNVPTHPPLRDATGKEIGHITLDIETILGPLVGFLPAFQGQQRTLDEARDVLGKLYGGLPNEPTIRARCCWNFVAAPEAFCTDECNNRVMDMKTGRCVGFLCEGHARLWHDSSSFLDATRESPEGLKPELPPHQIPPHLRVMPGVRRPDQT